MTTGLMSGKRGLVMGVANDHSIAWGIAKRLAEHGAELAFTYQTPALGKRVVPLAKSLGSDFVLPCDVGLTPDADDPGSLDAMFAALAKRWPSIDFIVHAIAFSDKSELRGRYADTSRANFVNTMLVSCFSFTEVARRAARLMTDGGAMVTLTFGGSTRVMPNYNVMGVAKAALEASVRYLAADFGPTNIRVNATVGGAGAHAGRRRHRRCPHHVEPPESQFAAPPQCRHRRDRQYRRLSAFRPLFGRHRRDPFRRFGLQHHRDAACR